MSESPPNVSIIETVIGLGSFFFGIVVALVRGAWQLASIKDEITKRIDDDINDLRAQNEDRHREIMRQFGDSLAALRQRTDDVERNGDKMVNELALWSRDNLVNHEHFTVMIEAINRNIDALSNRIEANQVKTDAKLDRLLTSR